jgi:hypothetical protein
MPFLECTTHKKYFPLEPPERVEKTYIFKVVACVRCKEERIRLRNEKAREQRKKLKK